MPRTTNQLDYYERIRKLSLSDRNHIREAFALPLPKRPTMDALARQYKVSRNVIFRIVHTPAEAVPSTTDMATDQSSLPQPDPL